MGEPEDMMLMGFDTNSFNTPSVSTSPRPPPDPKLNFFDLGIKGKDIFETDAFAKAKSMLLQGVQAETQVSTEKQRYKQLLTAFYSVHNPSNLPKVDTFLSRYAGKEALLLAKLEKKYRSGVGALAESPRNAHHQSNGGSGGEAVGVMVTGDGVQHQGEEENKLVNVRFAVHFQEQKLGLKLKQHGLRVAVSYVGGEAEARAVKVDDEIIQVGEYMIEPSSSSQKVVEQRIILAAKRPLKLVFKRRQVQTLRKFATIGGASLGVGDDEEDEDDAVDGEEYEVKFTSPKLGLRLVQRPGGRHVVSFCVCVGSCIR
jgi:hypothetical protein